MQPARTAVAGRKAFADATDWIRKFAVGLLEGRAIDDLDSGEDDQKGYLSLAHGAAPEVKVFATVSEEIGFIQNRVRTLVEEGTPISSICVVARTKKLVELYATHLRGAGVEVYEVKRVATMHRVKGLEFEHVIVAE